jgi:PleD family two-component response regulator
MNLSEKKILLIDDDSTFGKLITNILAKTECKLDICPGVMEALPKMQKDPPDLVMLDLVMPLYDGFTYLKFRQQNDKLAGIPVLVLSGTKNPAFIKKAEEMGAEYFLEKPIHSKHFMTKINSIFAVKK